MSFIEEREFEIEHLGRVFTGQCEVEWGVEPAQDGGRTDPSWDAYAYVENINIITLEWYGLNDGHYFEVTKCDRNWLRINKLLVEIEMKLEFEEPYSQDDGFRKPAEREPSDYEIDKAQTAYERSIGL